MLFTYTPSGGNEDAYTILFPNGWLAVVEFHESTKPGEQKAVMDIFVSALNKKAEEVSSKAEPGEAYDEDEWDTYDGWRDRGYHVRRGEKARKWTNGKALFSFEQVDEDEDYSEQDGWNRREDWP